jgi:hypothetical protein
MYKNSHSKFPATKPFYNWVTTIHRRDLLACKYSCGWFEGFPPGLFLPTHKLNLKARLHFKFWVRFSSPDVWYDMVWYSMVWYGMVWYGMVWYGMVWYGMVW